MDTDKDAAGKHSGAGANHPIRLVFQAHQGEEMNELSISLP